MSHGNSYIPLEEVLLDACQELRDEGFRKVGRPPYVTAAQRGVGKMMKDTMGDPRTWSAPVPENFILQLPDGLEEIDAAYLYNGSECNVSNSQVLRIKPNMHRLGGQGYLANDTWQNWPDPLQWSHGWSQQPPPWLYFAGRWQQQLHLSDSCSCFGFIRLDYQGLGISRFGDQDIPIPYWMRDAITDYVVMRIAQMLRREDPQYFKQIIDEKKYEMERGSWLTARGYFKRMDRKTRLDTKTYLETFGGIL